MKRLVLGLAVWFLGTGIAAGLWLVLRPPTDALPVIRPAPEFVGTDQDGKEFTAKNLEGRAFVADFFFTRCAGPCPVLADRLKELDKILPPGVLLVSFSMDPEYDSPEVLKKYAADMGASLKRWTFVSLRTTEARNALAKGFGVAAEDVPDESNPVLHDSHMVLVDTGRNVRGFYESGDPQVIRKLRNDAAAVSLAGIYGLPAVNAALNATSLLLLLAGLAFARAKMYEQHVAFVLGAVLASTVFLACYLTYHYLAGATRFPGTGVLRTLYLGVLLTHTVLAAAVPPLIIAVIVKAAKRRWDSHKLWARITVPVWTYVSGTGVLIYWVLFRTLG